MSKTTDYVLTGARWTRITGKGDNRSFERFKKGDIVSLSEVEYERLHKAFELPGESQRVEAERLKAQAEALQAEADAIAERADAAAEVADAGGATTTSEPQTSPADEREAELKKLKRAELDKVATKAGVENPDKLPNIGEVVKATLAAEAAAASSE